ncbi:GTP-binding protein [Gemella bergeri]
MKIILVSGFLGAGKTSFIKELVKQTKQKFVILENEFGELNLDAKELRNELEVDENMKVWELTEGCICCSLNLDFTHSVLTIANTLNPDYLIIEPSGVAMLSNLIRNFKKISYERIELGAPIVIIDAQNYKNTFKKYKTYLDDQLKYSSVCVLSKSENLSEEDFLTIKNELKIKDNIKYNLKHYSKWEKDFWFEILNIETLAKEKDNKLELVFKTTQHVSGAEKLEQLTLDKIIINSLNTLSSILLLLISGRFGEIERIKGYFSIGKNNFKFDVVGKNYVITGCEENSGSKVVVIGKNLEKKQIENLFKNF